MVVLSLLESIKDTASRFLPSQYKTVVENMTQPHLTEISNEEVVFLCNSTNLNAGATVEVVRAVRCRIAESDAKVQYLTVLVLDALIRNCDTNLHLEVAAQKGLLRDLESIATRRQCFTDKESMAKRAALTLILNLSAWFTGHPDGRLYILTTLNDDVRHAIGPGAFAGISPDLSVRIQPSLRFQRVRQPSSGHNSQLLTHSRRGQPGPRATVVDAIGVNLPKEEELAAMLDCCVTLAEYLNNAKILEDGSIEMDDVIRSFKGQITADHDLVTLILSSDIKLENRDVFCDISQSQSAIIRRLETQLRPSQERQEAQRTKTPAAAAEVLAPQKDEAPTKTATTTTVTAESKATIPTTLPLSSAPLAPLAQPLNAAGGAVDNKPPVAQEDLPSALNDLFLMPLASTENAAPPLLPPEELAGAAEEAQRPRPPDALEEKEGEGGQKEPTGGDTVEEGKDKLQLEEGMEKKEEKQAQQKEPASGDCLAIDDFDAFLAGRIS